MTQKLAKRLPSLPKTTKTAVQRITYQPCGCEAIGPAPMPKECPTHGTSTGGGIEADKVEVLVVAVLDRSYSMNPVRAQTISGYNTYLDNLQQDGKPYLVTLSQFDRSIGSPVCQLSYKNSPIRQAGRLDLNTYVPRGDTPLWDAVGITINEVSPEVKGRPVLFIVWTDGENNASEQFTAGQVKEMVKAKEQEGWTFIFMGSGIDAWAAGSAIGFQAANAATYTVSNIGQTMSRMAGATVKYASSRRAMFSNGSRGQSLNSSAMFSETGTTLADLGGRTYDEMQTISEVASNAGKASANKLTPAERKAKASKAAKTRWANAAKGKVT